jgi:outer membrane protein TolC
LNQPITTEIQFSETEVPINQNTLSLEEAITLARNNRLEFNQMDIASSMADQKIKMEKADKLPQLNFVGDYGFQGENYSFGSEDDYAMASVILSWNILEASHGPKVEQAKIDKELLIFQKEALRNKIELEVLDAFYDAETALKNIDLAKTKKESATKAYRVINKKFKQGRANLLEINNALTQLTDADQEIIISQFNYQVKFLAFEKAIGK